MVEGKRGTAPGMGRDCFSFRGRGVNLGWGASKRKKDSRGGK